MTRPKEGRDMSNNTNTGSDINPIVGPGDSPEWVPPPDGFEDHADGRWDPCPQDATDYDEYCQPPDWDYYQDPPPDPSDSVGVSVAEAAATAEYRPSLWLVSSTPTPAVPHTSSDDAPRSMLVEPGEVARWLGLGDPPTRNLQLSPVPIFVAGRQQRGVITDAKRALQVYNIPPSLFTRGTELVEVKGDSR